MLGTMACGAADCQFWHRNLGIKEMVLDYIMWTVKEEGSKDTISVGSGSPYAYGVLDNDYRYDISIEEAAELARWSIYHATFCDGASGGVASVYYVGPSGWKKLSAVVMMLENFITSTIWLCQVQWNRKWLK
ncbi:proteasome subunit beta type-5-a [Quercus suber]|uniref:Proteasome subunit beta type-5-a n=1 Tax=Quercus suber TaxID=58331 RepID=A0AAW0L439_QUESU